jgi:hypothetical protein
MRLRRLCAALLLSGATACTEPGPPLADRPGPPVAVTLTAAVTRTPTSLTWTYTLRNDEPVVVAVLSGSAESSHSPGAWVVPRDDDDTVEVSQRLFAQPPNVGLARPYTQLGTVLPAGATLAGSATVSLPLAVAHPYGSAFEPPLTLPKHAATVVFCIGVSRNMPPAPLETEPPDGGQAPSAALYGQPDGPAPAGARKARYVHTGGERQHLECVTHHQ